ncbi:flagellar export chaperone FliS [Biomaibacter acetigenes]|jgi:flagellar protein FliS|uniref:Flagellar export chaperone FliS n=1 Tax=Biomaibacter acetigenes TaxID=2316383 RepID=A0A3G2R3M4_9FIRM|nr:flagellar export chaperone FliS [Biomaibacter acetigenes]AYO29935.1 flagellar export chaperone FliS [Biomaibacter acetigenes]
MINAYQQYQQNSILLASPQKLLIMLYDGAIRFIKAARKAMEEKDFEQANYNLVRAQDIFSELNCNLDMDIDISKNLRSLYNFINDKLIQSNIKKSVEILDEIEPMVEDLRNTWYEASKKVKVPQQ